jgi:hypothetical protein
MDHSLSLKRGQEEKKRKENEGDWKEKKARKNGEVRRRCP